MKKLVTSCFLILAFHQLSLAQRAEQMTVAEILARVTSVYASCHAYSDEGEVSAKFDITFSRPMIYRFSTAFVRPAAFRFELRSGEDRKSTRLNSSHLVISYAVFCLKKKKKYNLPPPTNPPQPH